MRQMEIAQNGTAVRDEVQDTIQDLEQIRNDQLLKIEQAKKLMPIDPEDLPKIQEKIEAHTSHYKGVLEEAGRHPKLPPFLLATLGVFVAVIVILKLNKRFIAGFGTRLFVRLFVLVMAVFAIYQFGVTFVGEDFKRWVQVLFS